MKPTCKTILTIIAFSMPIFAHSLPTETAMVTGHGIGATKLQACSDAKRNAQERSAKVIRYGGCDCEKSTDGIWRCAVDAKAKVYKY